MEFIEAYEHFLKKLGKGKRMVLSTSYNDIVTSRTMSIIQMNGKLYFQTDRTSKKYKQLMKNPHISLCMENIQIVGQCKEIGQPLENIDFISAYKKNFLDSYTRYSSLANERLFEINPTYVEKWIYIDNIPFIEVLDIVNKQYRLNQYIGK